MILHWWQLCIAGAAATGLSLTIFWNRLTAYVDLIAGLGLILAAAGLLLWQVGV